MSRLESSSSGPRGVLVRRPKNSVYTMLLLAALIAIVLSCLLMVIELATYGFQVTPPANLSSAGGPIAVDAQIV